MADVRAIPASEAAARLAGISALDPRGMAREGDIASMCGAGRCLEVADGQGGSAVVIVHEFGELRWIEAAAGGGGADLTAAIDAALGPGPVAFQTKRRGLVRRSQKLGYYVAGYILRRDK